MLIPLKEMRKTCLRGQKIKSFVSVKTAAQSLEINVDVISI